MFWKKRKSRTKKDIVKRTYAISPSEYLNDYTTKLLGEISKLEVGTEAISKCQEMYLNNPIIITCIQQYTAVLGQLTFTTKANGTDISHIFDNTIYASLLSNLLVYDNAIVVYKFTTLPTLNDTDVKYLGLPTVEIDEATIMGIEVLSPPDVSLSKSGEDVSMKFVSTYLDEKDIELKFDINYQSFIGEHNGVYYEANIVQNQGLSTSIMHFKYSHSRLSTMYLKHKLYKTLIDQNITFNINNSNTKGIIMPNSDQPLDMDGDMETSLREMFNNTRDSNGRISVVGLPITYIPLNNDNKMVSPYNTYITHIEESFYIFYNIPIPLMTSKPMARDSIIQSRLMFYDDCVLSLLREVIQRTFYNKIVEVNIDKTKLQYYIERDITNIKGLVDIGLSPQEASEVIRSDIDLTSVSSTVKSNNKLPKTKKQKN